MLHPPPERVLHVTIVLGIFIFVMKNIWIKKWKDHPRNSLWAVLSSWTGGNIFVCGKIYLGENLLVGKNGPCGMVLHLGCSPSGNSVARDSRITL